MLPVAFNVAILASPLMAGHLADLRGRYTDRFRDSRFLEGFPYAPSALANRMILFVASSIAFFFLEEVCVVAHVKPRTFDHHCG